METSIWTKCKNAFTIASILAIVTILINLLLSGNLVWLQVKSQIFWSFYYGFSISLVNETFFEWLNIKISWKTLPKQRAWFGFFGSIAITMLTLFLLNYLYWILYKGNNVIELSQGRHKQFYLIGLGITIFISSIMHALGFYKWARDEQLINERLRKEKAETELNVLKAHIDPHFLFNSFNILSGLIDEDPTKAKKVLDELSAIYRYILDNRNDNTDTIRAEVQFAKKYLNIQQARFEDCIFLDIDIEENILDKYIPSLSLQMLLENAIKHNAFDPTNPLRIKIYCAEGMLIITNNKKSRTNLVEGKGIGLQNITDRYTLLTKQKIEIQNSDTHFTVKLPIIINTEIHE